MLRTADATAVATAVATHHRGTPVVVMTGEVDSTTVEPVRHHLFDQLDLRPPGLVVDLSGVSFIGSTGLHVLTEAATRAELSGTTLAVVARHRAVLLPMRLTRLDREVTVCDTVDQAVTAVSAR
ncbi:STAS domain-containing protein [Saccharothrix xinjiangensis]|uniref:Anti-sigma factor antagonist n=1 Tax=Saccharothrix xinjiangensis TaxID=204798 RepID=A0ABV9Y9A0_9PSEU